MFFCFVFFLLQKIYIVGEDPHERKFYLTLFTLAMVNIRLTSLGVELMRERRHSRCPHHGPSPSTNDIVSYRFIDVVLYTMYLPLYFTGPIITFDIFWQQVSKI